MEKRSPVNHRGFFTYFDYHNSILAPSRVSILQNTVAVLTSQRQGGLHLSANRCVLCSIAKKLFNMFNTGHSSYTANPNPEFV